jgi:hypothetical protein
VILTAHQPVYLPWLGLMHKIAIADLFVSLDHVQYGHDDWINRNRLKLKAGPSWLSVPVKKKGHLDKTIAEIEIDDTSPWRRKHWRTIQEAYARAPYFKDYAPFLEDTYSRDWKLLVDLNHHILTWLLQVLGISTPVYRPQKSDFEGANNALIIDICRKRGADTHVFGALARDYVDVNAFTRAGIAVVIQDYVHPTYPQLHGPFASHLSVIDLLFNCGRRSLDVIMSGNVARTELARVTA